MAEVLRSAEPPSTVTYVGRAGGPEARIVAAAGIEFVGLSLGRMGSSRLTAVPRLLTRLPLAYQQARQVISDFHPDVVLATGGYVSVPVALVARRRRIPLVLLEQNALPGRAVSWLARRANLVATSFPDTAQLLPGARVVCAGNPVRRQFSELAAADRSPELAPAILVMGGSQGAVHLNDVVLEALPRLLGLRPQVSVVHLTGPRDHARVRRVARSLQLDDPGRYRCLAFSDQMAVELNAAGMVVMRAGASSLAEVACLGKPMVLVPYPHASNHQMANANPFAAAGAAVVVVDSEFTAARLLAEASRILFHGESWERMSQASRAMSRPGAAGAVAALLSGLVEESP
ncbi:MAG: UDP-N-acetylglucosamine--N-acetylmuramyl-(pentapeptide) pyrophosphoryl-undecaprenol N-acetylglucosamine transferase [Candidatus Dormibacteria bacterium]